jgi:NOL1/NOP2/sun family putative RNA methylase
MERAEKVKNFLNKIKDIYGDKIGAEVIESVCEKTSISFRVNTLKTSVEKVLDDLGKLGFVIQKGNMPNSFYVSSSPDDLQLSRTDVFEKGDIYIQNFSSMIPAMILDPKPGECILDLCAAPGSKTTQIAVLSDNGAHITAVENNVSRFNALKNNAATQGVSDIEFIKCSAQRLLSLNPQFMNYFDKVLCDVPCSNEGLIRDPDSYDFSFWNPKNARKLAVLQKKLVSSAISMLKNGGTLIYSTCTYSVEENEQIIDWVLKKFPYMKIEGIHLENISTVQGLTLWKEKTFSPGLAKTVRILPGKMYEAFFIAKLERKMVE